MKRITRRQRFALWAAVVVVVLASPVWLMLGGVDRVWMMVGVAQSLAGLTGMVWLLRTTPGDAIRLPWWVSVVVIFGGFFWLTNVPVHAPNSFNALMFAMLVILIVVSEKPSLRTPLWAVTLAMWHPATAMYVQSIGATNASRGVVIATMGAFVAAHFVNKDDRGTAAWFSWCVSVGAMVWAVAVR